MCINKNQTGLAAGGTFAALHAVWMIIVSAGYGQNVIDALLERHMIFADLAVMPFSLTNAIVLLAIAFLFGYAFGWVFAAIWNWAGTKTAKKKR